MSISHATTTTRHSFGLEADHPSADTPRNPTLRETAPAARSAQSDLDPASAGGAQTKAAMDQDRRQFIDDGVDTGSAVLAQAAPPNTIDPAAEKIRSLVRDDGVFGTSRNEHLHQIDGVLNAAPPADVNRIVSKLGDDDLKQWAGDINSGGIFGAQGLSGDEKGSLMQTLAKDLDGGQLARMSKAFDNRDDVIALGKAVAQSSSADVKVAYVKALAPAAGDRENKTDAGFGTSSSVSGDKEAYAIGEVLTSLKGNPAAFNEALGALGADKLGSVVKALENERMTTTSAQGNAAISFSHDPSPLKALLDAGAAAGTAENKAALFQAASPAITEIRASNTLLSPNPGADASAATVTAGLTALLDSDVRGVVDRLNTDESTGKSLATYTQQVLRENPSASNGILGRQLAQLQGVGTGRAPAQYIGQPVKDGQGHDFYRNAENLGYYSGAVQAGINKTTADAKAQGDIFKNIFTAGLFAGSAAFPGAPVAVKVAVPLVNGLGGQSFLDAAASVSAGNRSLRDAFGEAALPHDPTSQDRVRGAADPFYQGSEATVIQANQ
jgi:hypothetical protein